MGRVRREPRTAVQECELDQKATPHDLTPESLDQIAQRACRPAGGEQIVVDEHTGAVAHRVCVQLQLACAVLEQILGADRLVG